MSIVEQAIRKLQESRRAAGLGPDRGPALGVLREVEDARADDGHPVRLPPRRVVQVDKLQLDAAGFLPPDHKQRQIGDQFRHIKRPLLAAALGRGMDPVANGRLIMLASSLPGEGKTFTGVNLALSMALEKDISVLLVDADVAKPHISRMFGIDGEPGLLEVLQDESLDAESLVLPTDVPGLSLLSAGKPSETATELLASERMQTVVAALGTARDVNRVVLFDSPPLLLTSESRALARPMGQVVLVVQAARTPQHAVFDAIDCLGGQKPVALVLNQSEVVEAAGYYYRNGAYGNYATYGDRESRSA